MRRFVSRPSGFALAFALGVATAAVAPATQGFAADSHEAKQNGSTDESFLDYTHEQKEDAVSWVERQLVALDAEIEEAERDWKRSETKEDVDAVTAELAEKRDAAARELDDLGDASADAWQDAKTEARQALEDLQESYRETKRRIAD